jgi:hypothetical protein
MAASRCSSRCLSTSRSTWRWISTGRANIQDARAFADRLLTCYNTDHRHSQIRYVTPQERHEGRDVAILAQRQQVYADARQRHPQRWSAGTRNWSRTEQVTLNPHRVEQVQSPKR